MGTEKKAAAEVQENQTEQAAAQVQAPVAYCGPTIKGIAPQYTVFVDGLPDKLKVKLEEDGTRENILCNKAAALMK